MLSNLLLDVDKGTDMVACLHLGLCRIQPGMAGVSPHLLYLKVLFPSILLAFCLEKSIGKREGDKFTEGTHY